MHDSINVNGTELQNCSTDPLTGWFRDGCCNTDSRDRGSHTVCAILTDDFLQFAKSQGNDLITPSPQFGFPGLKAGDRWCVCVDRWIEAYLSECAPKIILEATNQSVISKIEIKILKKFALDLN